MVVKIDPVVEDTMAENDAIENIHTMESINYELSWLDDNIHLPVFKISRLLDVITGMDVTVPALREKESLIPFDLDPEYILKFVSMKVVI